MFYTLNEVALNMERWVKPLSQYLFFGRTVSEGKSIAPSLDVFQKIVQREVKHRRIANLAGVELTEFGFLHFDHPAYESLIPVVSAGDGSRWTLFGEHLYPMWVTLQKQVLRKWLSEPAVAATLTPILSTLPGLLDHINDTYVGDDEPTSESDYWNNRCISIPPGSLSINELPENSEDVRRNRFSRYMKYHGEACLDKSPYEVSIRLVPKVSMSTKDAIFEMFNQYIQDMAVRKTPLRVHSKLCASLVLQEKELYGAEYALLTYKGVTVGIHIFYMDTEGVLDGTPTMYCGERLLTSDTPEWKDYLFFAIADYAIKQGIERIRY